VAVAFSGGGDSLALLLAAKLWADKRGRTLAAFTVDHGLQPQSAAWAAFAAERAGRLGIAHRTLAWRGEKRASGLPAAARAARHALLAAAATAIGARVILMGHTADDLIEAGLMRAEGAATPSPREWSPSPAWPAGREVFLLRPLLGVRRGDLRAWLEALGERWIDDPANDDERFARARARRRLAGGAPVLPPTHAASAPCAALAQVREGVGGELETPRTALRGTDARRLLGALCLSAAGGVRPPRAAALERLLKRLGEPGDVVAALAGARVEAAGERVRVCREAGEFARVGLASRPLPSGASVFDGRFEIIAEAPGWSVRPLRGMAAQLSGAERDKLARLAASVRGTLPVVIAADGRVSSPVLANGGPIRARALAGRRLLAAMGGIPNEAALWRVAKPSANP
jgi:tRNA(Ile)-lysidine synthase